MQSLLYNAASFFASLCIGGRIFSRSFLSGSYHGGNTRRVPSSSALSSTVKSWGVCSNFKKNTPGFTKIHRMKVKPVYNGCCIQSSPDYTLSQYLLLSISRCAPCYMMHRPNSDIGLLIIRYTNNINNICPPYFFFLHLAFPEEDFGISYRNRFPLWCVGTNPNSSVRTEAVRSYPSSARVTE